MADTFLTYDNVTFAWPGTNGQLGSSLHDINLAVNKGDFLLITGPSGAGKSTLLRLAVWLEEPQKGQLLFKGKPYKDFLPHVLRQNMGFVQQLPVLLPGSIRDNFSLPFEFAANKGLKKPNNEKMQNMLAGFGLEVPLDTEANTLSVGQQQRVCIIRTLLQDPTLLLLDEPTSALDPHSRVLVEQYMEGLNERGVTILLVSHSNYMPVRQYRHIRVQNGMVVEEKRTGAGV